MKPAPFTYHLARGVAEAIALLAELAPGNPLGLRGAGEGGVSAAGAALASAVRDALGLAGSVGRLPLTAARVQALAASTREDVRCTRPG